MIISASFETHPSHLIEIVHEHLAHLVDGDGGVDGAVEPQFAHSVRQSAQMQMIGVREQHCVHLMGIPDRDRTGNTHHIQEMTSITPPHRPEIIPLQGIYDVHGETFIPATVQQEAELIHL